MSADVVGNPKQAMILRLELLDINVASLRQALEISLVSLHVSRWVDVLEGEHLECRHDVEVWELRVYDCNLQRDKSIHPLQAARQPNH